MTAFVLLSALGSFHSSCIAQSAVSAAHPSAKSNHAAKAAPSEGLLACEKKIADIGQLGDHITQVSAAILVGDNQQLSDCVFSEMDLSVDDLRGAYAAKDLIEKEIGNRVSQIGAQFDSQQKENQDRLRKASDAYATTNTQFNALIGRYNNLVEKFNSLVDLNQDILANDRQVAQEIRQATATCKADYLNSVVQSLQNQRSSVPASNSLPRSLHCTTQHMPAPIPGQPAWSYTTCN